MTTQNRIQYLCRNRKFRIITALLAVSLFPSLGIPSSEVSEKDRKKIHLVNKISKAIKTLLKKNAPRAGGVAEAIYEASTEYNLDPKLMVAIIMQESSFRQTAVTEAGDFSISQINFSIWSKEFLRIGREPLDLNKLKTDKSYAIKRMAEILSILAERHKNDKAWYAVYHSKSYENKHAYERKISTHLDKINAL